MLCSCGLKTEVYDSKVVENGKTVWRRRRCPTCTTRITTYERTTSCVEEVMLLLSEQLKDDMKRIDKFHAPFLENLEKGDEWDDPVWVEVEQLTESHILHGL